MIDLKQPDARRGMRTVVQALVQFALIGLIYSLVDDLHGDTSALSEIARFALIIVIIDSLGYALENGARAIKFSASKDGISADASGNTDEPVSK
jgi:hypothetical protein